MVFYPCRAGCPHPAAERHHKIVPPAHVTLLVVGEALDEHHGAGRKKHQDTEQLAQLNERNAPDKHHDEHHAEKKDGRREVFRKDKGTHDACRDQHPLERPTV